MWIHAGDEKYLIEAQRKKKNKKKRKIEGFVGHSQVMSCMLTKRKMADFSMTLDISNMVKEKKMLPYSSTYILKMKTIYDVSKKAKYVSPRDVYYKKHSRKFSSLK